MDNGASVGARSAVLWVRASACLSPQVGTAWVQTREDLVRRLAAELAAASDRIAGVEQGAETITTVAYLRSWSGALVGALAACRTDDVRRGVGAEIGVGIVDLGVFGGGAAGVEDRPEPSRHRVSWAPATHPAVHDLLTNPNYAGAYVFGRTRTEKRVDPNGRLVTRTRLLPREEWSVLICDHHPGFVSWERYERIQDELRANWRPLAEPPWIRWRLLLVIASPDLSSVGGG